MEKALKVLMISSDRKLLEVGSGVSERMKDYGALVEEIHIVLMSDSPHGLKDGKISANIWVYPTNSMFSLLRPLDAARLGKKIVFEKKFVRGKSLITAQDIESGWAGLRIKKKWRIPLEVQLHTDPFSPYFKGFQNIARKFFMSSILRNADSIRVVNEALKYKMAPLTRAFVNVLPIYIDRKKIEGRTISFDVHARYPWHFIMLAVSRLAPEKNMGLTLQILSMVRQRFPNTGLIIVGSGPEEKKLKSKVKSLKLDGAVEFAGWQDELASFYKTSNVFLQTSLFEGYGLSLVEAGLSGLPVITTPVGVAQELQHGTDAYIYPPDRPDLFASGIIELIENNQKRENLRFNLKKTLESKLLSKDAYLGKLISNWGETASKVKV